MSSPPSPPSASTDSSGASERFARVEALFHAALDQPADRRDAWLAAACAGDGALLSEVRDLLAHDADDSPGPLRSPAERLQADDELADGALIDGRYRVGVRLGAGGLGVVHLAEQLEPVRRQVALKVGRKGLDDASALALFQAESRALSLVSHPGIAQVYDAGRTARGRFYVAMELVDGVPLTDYCAAHRLDLGARLRLFIDVCRAVQHAHQRGVIHRDLKPSNVLVTRHGEVAWPKVIDFGIAQHAGTASADAPEPILGTPAYMSPEQAQGEGADVDTRADVYSLGVILYELLTGALPYSTSAATRRDLPALREVLRGPLVSPSTRVRTATRRGGAATSVPPIQHSALRGDLDAVVGKAMAFDRTARYATVSELAADVDRALRKVPVSARPHTATYLMGSFVRRHRVLVAAVAVLMVGIAVTGVVMVRLSADRAEQRRIAEREAAAAETQRDIALRTAQLAERLRARSLLMAAATALDAGDAGTTLTNLDAIGEAHRGWEWRYLHLEADRSEVTFGAEPRAPNVLPGKPGSARPSAAISTLAVAASAPRLAAGDAAGAVRVWRLDAPQTPVRTLAAHEVAVAGLALSPEGRLVATTDLARSVRVWEVDTGALLWEAAGVVSLGRAAFSPDGARLALGVFGDHAVSIRDALRGQVLDRVPLVMPTAYRPTWVDDGGTGAGALLVTDLSRTQRVDVATHAVVWTRPLRLVEAAGSERFVARTLPNYVGWALCDAKTGDTVRPLGDETAVVDALDVSLDGAWTARAGATTLDLTEDGVVAAAEGLANEVHPVRNQLLPGHEGAITAVVFASRTRPAGTAEARVGDPVFTGDSAGVVKGWSTATWPEPYVVPRSNDVIFAGAATSDGAVVVTGGWGAVKGWDAVLGMERWTRLVGRAYVSAVAPDPGRTRVAVGDWRGVLRVLDLADGAERLRVQLDVVRVVALAWAPDGRIVVGREDGRIDVVDARTGVVEQSVAAHRSAIRALALSPDGAFLASGSGDGAVWPVINEERPNEGADASVRLWRWPGLEAVVEMPGHGASVRSVAFAPDGARLVSGGSDRTLKMWSVPDGRLLATRVGVGHEVTAVAFTTDGSRLVTAHGEGPLLIWDATELELLATLPGGLGPMLWAGFSADGRTLTALGRSMALVRFETDRDAARGRARAEVRAARAAVDAMVGVRSADDLARLLEARTDLPAAVRGRAVAIARARGDHALMLNSAAWGRVLTPGQDAASLAEALAASTTAVGARPDDWMAWSTLALARYRVRDFAGALAAAERCMAIQREIGHAEDPLGDAVRVMILAGLGRVGEARTLLDATRPAMQREDMRLDHEAWSLFAEAEVAVQAAESSPGLP